MNAPTDWMSALAIVAAGLVLGLLVFFASRRRKASAASKRPELEARRDALVQQLRELGDDVVGDERIALESETAEVLRALDALPAASVGMPAPRRRSAATGFVWGAVCALIAVGIVYYGSTFAKDRQTAAAPPPPQQMSAGLKQLEEAVRTDPKNADHRIALAKAYFGQNDLMASFEQTKAVLDQDPNEPRALTYNAVVRMSMGELDGARAMLEQATERDPKLLDAWVALASARTQSGDAQGASIAINSAIAHHPEEEARLRSVFVEIQKQAPSAQHPSTPTPVASNDLPPDHPPMPGMTSMPASAPAPTAAAGPAPKPIHVTLSLDPTSSVKSGIVYVIARGAEKGHPLAVKRIEAAAFPLSVDLGGDDVMMGQPFPPSVRIEARLDSDGDAGTKNPSDLSAFANGVPVGTSVTLKLAKMN